MDALSADLQKILDESVASGEECGCQLTVYRHGKLICDLYSGWTDESRSRKVDSRTLFPVFSVGKGIVTTLFHIYAEQHKIEYDDPVSKYWPEYACNGKEETKVWHFLSHRAAMWDFPKDYNFQDWFDWDKACAVLAASAPLGPIGGIHRYHAHTYGLLVGKVLENAVGIPLRELLRKTLLDPLKIDTFFYGMPESRRENLALIVPCPDKDGKVFSDSRVDFNDQKVLGGLNPSSNGTSNAHALARIYASLIEDGVDGVRFLKDSTLQQVLQLCRAPEDVMKPDQWDKFGYGYALCGPEAPWNRMFGHGGACGSEGFADRETGYAVGFTKNKLNLTHPDHPTRNAISKRLGIPVRVW